jgi:hypothetical protein
MRKLGFNLTGMAILLFLTLVGCSGKSAPAPTPPAIVNHVLTVNSSNPTTGAGITASPVDHYSKFCVSREKSDLGSRNTWIRDVCTALESDHIGWAMWDYHGGFGVMLKRSGEPGQPDPATLEALGLRRN